MTILEDMERAARLERPKTIRTYGTAAIIFDHYRRGRIPVTVAIEALDRYGVSGHMVELAKLAARRRLRWEEHD